MSFAEKLAQQSKAIRSKREEIALQRAYDSVSEFLQTPQFKNTVLSTPEGQMSVTAITKNIVSEMCDPINAFLDTLSSRGLIQSEIHKTVALAYDIIMKDDVRSEQDSEGHIKLIQPHESKTYQEMLPLVADYCFQHQEFYTTLLQPDVEE